MESRFDPTSGLLTANAYALPFAICEARRDIGPLVVAAVGLKALLSIHRVYAPAAGGRKARGPALIARQVSSPKSAQTSCSRQLRGSVQAAPAQLAMHHSAGVPRELPLEV